MIRDQGTTHPLTPVHNFRISFYLAPGGDKNDLCSHFIALLRYLVTLLPHWTSFYLYLKQFVHD